MLVLNQLRGIGIWLMLYGYFYLYVFTIGAVPNK